MKTMKPMLLWSVCAGSAPATETSAQVKPLHMHEKERSGFTVPMVRIRLRGTFRRSPCGGGALAFQWNYYEKHQNALPARVPDDLRVLRAVLRTTAGASIQLA